jgi:hypothetical protein
MFGVESDPVVSHEEFDHVSVAARLDCYVVIDLRAAELEL